MKVFLKKLAQFEEPNKLYKPVCYLLSGLFAVVFASLCFYGSTLEASEISVAWAVVTFSSWFLAMEFGILGYLPAPKGE